jgi:tetratricopeptide (TPR) repeat protein
MIGWFRLLLMVFYAPVRGIREVRDQGSMAPMALMAFLCQVAWSLSVAKFAGAHGLLPAVFSFLYQSAGTLVKVSLVLVPLLTLVANTFERRGSFRVVITQEYAPVAATLLYVLTAVNVASIIIAAFLHFTGIQAAYVTSTMQQAEQIRAMYAGSPQLEAAMAEQLANPVTLSLGLFGALKLILFAIGTIVGVKEAFRFSFLRAIVVTVISSFAAILVSALLNSVRLLASPFLLFMLFLFLRGYFTEIIGQQRAKAAFKQNLEAATLNPADASAHYNLGLIYQQRGELDAARERFEKAIAIDSEEIDAYYQLGRIARAQKRYQEAIGNFEQVVTRNPAHSLHEVWREVAATYVAAEQFEDARNALEQFLEQRPSDPEGLYLMGRAHAGLGHRREAASSMQACIEAVKTAPAYKYRLGKRWLNEAQQFLRSQAS